MSEKNEIMPGWFKSLTLAFWRALILKALGTPEATYDPAALDQVIAANKQ